MDLNWTCFSVHMRTERYDIVPFQYDIVPFQFLVHFSVPPNFWTCFGTVILIFFRTRVNATPLRTTFWAGTERYDIVPVWIGSQYLENTKWLTPTKSVQEKEQNELLHVSQSQIVIELQWLKGSKKTKMRVRRCYFAKDLLS